MVVPGTYAVRMVLDGRTFTQRFLVKPDPRDRWTQAQYRAGYAFAKKYSRAYGRIDVALNHLDAIGKSLAAAAIAAKTNAALTARIADLQRTRETVFASFTANYHNDEDSIQMPGSLRESVPRAGFGVQAPPTAEQLRYAAEFDAAYDAAFKSYNALVAKLSGLDGALKAAGVKPIEGAKSEVP